MTRREKGGGGGGEKRGNRGGSSKKAKSTGAEDGERQKDRRGRRREGKGGRGSVNGKREKARNVWRFGVMRFNYKTRRVLQLARRRTPHPRPSFATPALPFLSAVPRLFTVWFALSSQPPPTPIVLSLVFLASAGTLKTTSPLHLFRSVKDSRIARPRTPHHACC